MQPNVSVADSLGTITPIHCLVETDAQACIDTDFFVESMECQLSISESYTIHNSCDPFSSDECYLLCNNCCRVKHAECLLHLKLYYGAFIARQVRLLPLRSASYVLNTLCAKYLKTKAKPKNFWHCS